MCDLNVREESREQSLLKKIKKVFEKRLGYMKKVSYICIIDLRPTGDERYSVTQIEKFFKI